MLFSSLGKGEAKKKKGPTPRESPIAEMIGYLCYGVYALPALWGYGDLWYLSKQEQALLGSQGEAAIASMPETQAAKVVAILKKYAPATTFASSLVVVTGKRIQETKQLMEAYRAQLAEAQRARGPGGTADASPNVRRAARDAGGTESEARAPRATLTELFERTDE